MDTILWVRHPYPFLPYQVEGIQQALRRLFCNQEVQDIHYIIEHQKSDNPAYDALFHSLGIRGGNEQVLEQVAVALKAIHLAAAAAQCLVDPEWFSHPSMLVEITSERRPSWIIPFTQK